MRIFRCHGFPIISKSSKFVCFYFCLMHAFTPSISKESRRVIHEISVPVWLLVQPYPLWICDISAGGVVACTFSDKSSYFHNWQRSCPGLELRRHCACAAKRSLGSMSVDRFPPVWTVDTAGSPLTKRWLKRGKVRLPTPPCWAINGDIYRERFSETCWAEARKLGSLHWLRYSRFRWDHLE